MYLGDGKYAQTDGQDVSGVAVLFPALVKVTTVYLSDCGLGPSSIAELAKAISSAGAALIKVDVSGNPEIRGEGKTALQTAIQGRQPTVELVA